MKFYAPNGTQKRENSFTLAAYINYFVHPTAFLRREVYLQDGFYDEDFLKGQDWELWQRLNAKGVCFGIVPEVLLDYRLLEVPARRPKFK